MLLGTPSDLGVRLPLPRRNVGNEHTRVHFHRSLLASGQRGPWSQESLREQQQRLSGTGDPSVRPRTYAWAAAPRTAARRAATLGIYLTSPVSFRYCAATSFGSCLSMSTREFSSCMTFSVMPF